MEPCLRKTFKVTVSTRTKHAKMSLWKWNYSWTIYCAQHLDCIHQVTNAMVLWNYMLFNFWSTSLDISSLRNLSNFLHCHYTRSTHKIDTQYLRSIPWTCLTEQRTQIICHKIKNMLRDPNERTQSSIRRFCFEFTCGNQTWYWLSNRKLVSD